MIRRKALMVDRPDFPTMDQVEKASREQLAKWYRFLPSGDTNEQQRVQDRIAERFRQLGGMTPELSKRSVFSGSFATVCYHFSGITPKPRLEISSLRAASNHLPNKCPEANELR